MNVLFKNNKGQCIESEDYCVDLIFKNEAFILGMLICVLFKNYKGQCIHSEDYCVDLTFKTKTTSFHLRHAHSV